MMGDGILRAIVRDLRHAVRGAIRRPAYSVPVIATLAIGIGANTAIFSVFNWILFRPVPGVARPGELVTIRFVPPSASGARFFVSYRDIADLRSGMPALSGLAAAAPLSMNVRFENAAEPERVEGEVVTANFFDVLDASPREGRRFHADEERPGSLTPAAIISDALSRRILGHESPLGRPLTINGRPFTIVGVMPESFHGPSLLAPAQLWVPIGAHRSALPSEGADLLTNRRRSLFLEAIGRLRPDASIAQARDQAAAVGASVNLTGRDPARSRIVPQLAHGLGLDPFTGERLRTVWRLLTVAVGLVLLLACANAANLLLARCVARRREIAVCQAIGASRARLIREQFTEGVVLAFGAGAAGLALAQGLLSAFDGMRIVNFLPAVAGVRMDWRVALFAASVAVATGILFSLAPAIVASRVDLQGSLKDGGTASRFGGGRLRAAMVVIQVAIGLVILVGAGLFGRTLHNIRTLDLGVELDGLSTFSADPTRIGYDETRARRYFTEMLERLRSTPGITSAAFAWRLPYSFIGSDTSFTRADATGAHGAETNNISPGYFLTLGVPLLAGRDFTDADVRQETDRNGVVIVSQKLAREVFPAGNALGSRLVLKYPQGKVVEIVGVVGDVRQRPVTNEPEPYMYRPGQSVWGSVAVRSTRPFADTAAAVRAVARQIDPSLPPYDLEPMAAGLDRVIAEQRLMARLSAVFAITAALLAAIGIYGMMAGVVAERRREFGIRLALGAPPLAVLNAVLASAVRIGFAGVVIGLAIAALATRAVESRLYSVGRFDPLTLSVACAGLLALVIAASLLPARRAMRVDPMRSLRVD
jgi:predicted permease